MADAWISKDYLADGYVAPGWLLKQSVTVVEGAWLNKGYTSKKWIATQWIHFPADAVGSETTVGNVPALTLTALAGSAKNVIRVNATAPTLPLTKFNAVANAGNKVTQANVPGLTLTKFNATVNGGTAQVGSVSFTLSVASTIRYTKAVVAQNVLDVSLDPVEAIVTEGTDVNVPATGTSLPLAVFSTSVKANSSTRAVSSLALPLTALSGSVSIGKAIQVQNTLSLSLEVNDVAIVETPNVRLNVHATLIAMDLEALSSDIEAVSVVPPPPRANRIATIRRVERKPLVSRDRRERVI